MKIIQINSLKNAGSTGRIAEGIGLKVIEQGGQSYIAYGRSANPGTSVAINIGNRGDQLLHLINTRIFDNHGFHSAQATRSLIKTIITLNPDIIHLHNLHGYYLNVELLFRFLGEIKTPVIWTIHDCWPFTGHCCYYERIKCHKWKVECHSCELKGLYPQSYICDNSRKNFSRKRELFNLPAKMNLITVSHWLEDQVRESYLNRYPVNTIYNGVDLSVFKPLDRDELRAKYGFADKKVILGVANVWSEGKGLQSFIELSRLIRQNWQIVLIGLTRKQIKTLPTYISGIEKTNNIRELANYYNIADVFVTPSIAETFGFVAAEALACGTPVVAFNSSSLPELINEEVGFVVPMNDLKMLYQRVNEIIDRERSTYAPKCRRRAEELFDMNRQYGRYIELYSSLLRHKSKAI